MERELEEIYSKSQKLYWNDPEFHARCMLAFKYHQILLDRVLTGQEMQMIITSVYYGQEQVSS